MEQDGDQGDAAPVVAPPGGLPALPPGPPMAEPLDMGSIGAAVNAITTDSAPIITVLEGMVAKIDNLAMENKFTKQENLQLVAAARKAKLSATLATALIQNQVIVLEEMSRLLLRDNEVHQITKDSS